MNRSRKQTNVESKQDGGMIKEQTGDYTLAMVTIAFGHIAGAIVVLLLGRTLRSESVSPATTG